MTSLSQGCNHLTIVTVLYNFYTNACPTSVADSIYGDSWRWGHSEFNPLSNATYLCIIKAELRCIKFAKWQVVCGVMVYCFGCVSSCQVTKPGCRGGESGRASCQWEDGLTQWSQWTCLTSECISSLFLYQNSCNFGAAWQHCRSV